MYNCVRRNARTPTRYPRYGTPTSGFGRVISSRLGFIARRIVNVTGSISPRVGGNLVTGFRNRYARMNVCLTVDHRTSHRNCPRVTRTFGHCTFRRTSRTSHFYRLLNSVM